MQKINLPYGRHEVTEDDIKAVVEVLRSDRLTCGPAVERFERNLARDSNQDAVAVSSGTAALHLALLAFGVKAGREVITTPLTFAATANAILLVGAKPVFVDVDTVDLNIDPEKAASAITKKTAAIIPVHYAGRPCRMYDVSVAALYSGSIPVIDDACHALGAKNAPEPYGSFRMPGACASVFSFHPVKHVAAGEGGAILGNRGKQMDTIRRLRNHGISIPEKDRTDWRYDVAELGLNYRMSDINAALADSQLKRLDANIKRRRELAEQYMQALRDYDEVVLPLADDATCKSAWHLFVVRVPAEKRERVYMRMRAHGIGVNVHYKPVYLHSLYQGLGYKPGLCPVAEQAYKCMITLPLFPAMSSGDVDRVASALADALRDSRGD